MHRVPLFVEALRQAKGSAALAFAERQLALAQCRDGAATWAAIVERLRTG